ncbi:2-hydroxyacid dehydrogenase [Alteromonas sp. 1_MG-2023]|uniref:2-hydroxyacid dehydrogenase n=1 Tax=Alteromonas sp. 1_MG-2023 TaxID=3062669 RepID=UPI0026E336D5|nr:2-hydroxyacid dehydrogenase [Alteromonas sp. 1_MG-2023]MDO6565952.1 2-hydroxyacid dehydrogenase [Alteromonas sp. 1_MG-2023]
MKVAFFSAKPYEEAVFKDAAENGLDTANTQDPISFSYFPHQLTAETALLCQGYDAVCVFVNDELNAKTLAILHEAGVKHIALRCAGFNNVDIATAQELNISVSRVPAYSPETVAEHTLALILTLNRKTHKAYNRVKEGNFELSGLLGFTLHNKTVGVIGTGRIGQAVIRILKGFGCNVLCYDPYPNEQATQDRASYVSLETLFTDSQIVTLHCPLSEQSYHLINASSLALMPKGAMLINTSRGGLIDDKAVIDGLKRGHLGYVGLDVYERESELFFSDHSQDIIQDDIFQRLLTFPNVLVTGHQGFFTQEALREIAAITLDNLRFFAGDTSLNVNNNMVKHIN